jgi:hypothetical protein
MAASAGWTEESVLECLSRDIRQLPADMHSSETLQRLEREMRLKDRYMVPALVHVVICRARPIRQLHWNYIRVLITFAGVCFISPFLAL